MSKIDKLIDESHEARLRDLQETQIERIDLNGKKVKFLEQKDSRVYRKGILFYIWNPKIMTADMKDLPYIEPTLRLRSTSETFALREPSMVIKGKPVWFVVRGIPYSLELRYIAPEIIDLELNIEGSEARLELVHPPSHEIDAIISSIHTERVFRQHKLLPYQIYSIVLVIICSNVIQT